MSPPVRKVNLTKMFTRFQDQWSPKIVGAVNDSLVKLTKLKGEFVWHHHEREDELFLVVKGRLRMKLKDQELVIEPGEFVIIPHGVEHLPVAEEETHVVLFEPNSTLNTGNVRNERTVAKLDPADAREWEELRQLGHRMVDEMLEYLRTVRERPVWRPVPVDVRKRLSGSAPRAPSAAADVYEEFKRDVLPYPTGNTHPRFWGWVIGTGTPVAMLADMLASGMNPQVAEFDDASAVVENQVIVWLVVLPVL